VKRARKMYNELMDEFNSGPVTPQKVMAIIIRKSLDHAILYSVPNENHLKVADAGDMLSLADELENL
jgi:hypothetical protein